MHRLVLASLLFAIAAADTYCNYQPTGEEILVESVPVASYAESGSSTPRPGWCIAGCDSRVSVKGMMKLKPGNSSTPTYHMFRHTDHRNRLVSLEAYDKSTKKPIQFDDDNTFCIDTQVAALVDAVFDKYDDLQSITNGLNTFVNKPGWAFLVIENVGDSITEANNVKQDFNFCYKNMMKQIGNQYAFFDVFSGAVDDSK